MNSIIIFIISLFLTETKNLLPVPLSETQREVVFALLIMIFSAKSFAKLQPRIFNSIIPIFCFVLLASFIDILLGRFGFYSLVFWVKLLTVMTIAVVVYDLGINNMKKIIKLCAVILIAQLALFLYNPTFFAQAGRAIGVNDTFTIYGATHGRIYYAFFQANTAAHSIFFLFLSWYALCSVKSEESRTSKYGVALTFITLGLMTGSRAFIFLMAGFLLSRLFINRSRVIVACITLAPPALLFIAPIQNAIIDLYLLREASNTARANAIQQYFQYIESAPIVGHGYDMLRYYEIVLGSQVSHVIYIELLAAYGIFIGGLIIGWLFYIFVVQARSTSLSHVGFFALAQGLFSSSFLLSPTFFPLLLPTILALSSLENSRGSKSAQMPSPVGWTPTNGRI